MKIEWDEINSVVDSINWDSFLTFSEYEFKNSNSWKEKYGSWENYLKNINSKYLSVKQRLKSNNFKNWSFELEYHKNGETFVGAFYLLPILIHSLKIIENKYKEMIIDDIRLIIRWDPFKTEFCNFIVKPKPFPHYIPSKNGMKLPLKVACNMVVYNNIEFFQEQIINGIPELKEDYIDLIISTNFSDELITNFFEKISDEVDQNLKEYIRRELH